MAISTGDSNRADRMMQEADERGQFSRNPGWFFYEVWAFTNLCILNFSGILKEAHGGTCLGYLDAFLDEQYPGSNWRARFGAQYQSSYRHGMRAVLTQLIGAGMWLEMTFGTSYQGYNCIDAYISIFCRV